MGLFVGGQITMLRVYLAESSIRLIAMLPPEKQKTSTIKYTAYFIYFTSGIFCVMLGPGNPVLRSVFIQCRISVPKCCVVIVFKRYPLKIIAIVCREVEAMS